MSQPSESTGRKFVRIGTTGAPAFQLRKGEEGLSVFDPEVAWVGVAAVRSTCSTRCFRHIQDLSRLGVSTWPPDRLAALPGLRGQVQDKTPGHAEQEGLP
jgi:hypothetical protein